LSMSTHLSHLLSPAGLCRRTLTKLITSLAASTAAPTTSTTSACAASADNQKKGPNIASIDPETGVMMPLYHPRRHSWLEHFEAVQARITGLTPEGRTTVQLMD